MCVTDIYSKYALVIPLKDKNGITITNAFQKILNELHHKPNKTWVDKCSDYRSMKSFLHNNDIEMYSMHNEGKSVVATRSIRTLQKNVYIDKLADIVNKYTNTYHSTIKMKPVDVKLNTYIDSTKMIKIKILNLKHMKIFLQKVTLQIGLKKFL